MDCLEGSIGRCTKSKGRSQEPRVNAADKDANGLSNDARSGFSNRTRFSVGLDQKLRLKSR